MTGLPPISVLVPTYGRTALLGEVLSSFMRQDYPGDAELIILNDLPEQTLSWGGSTESRRVHVINLPQRISDLGTKRNRLVDLALHDIVQFWDDDDIQLPHRLSLGYLLLHATTSAQTIQRPATREEKEWSMRSDGSLRLRYARPLGTATMLKSSILSVGGFPSLERHQDCKLADKMAKALMFHNLTTLDVAPSSIYRVDGASVVANVSGAPSHDASDVRRHVDGDVMRRLSIGAEPSGKVELSARWSRDYVSMVASEWAAVRELRS